VGSTQSKAGRGSRGRGNQPARSLETLRKQEGAMNTQRKVTLAVRFKVMQRDKYKCRLCGRDIQDGVKLEVDHVIPVSAGGSDELNNLWTLCFDCNRGKNDNPLFINLLEQEPILVKVEEKDRNKLLEKVNNLLNRFPEAELTSNEIFTKDGKYYSYIHF
jgi:5-methylcytosine-specific restriction endonuclease McrA